MKTYKKLSPDTLVAEKWETFTALPEDACLNGLSLDELSDTNGLLLNISIARIQAEILRRTVERLDRLIDVIERKGAA